MRLDLIFIFVEGRARVCNIVFVSFSRVLCLYSMILS